jgi:hypothetical protein
MSADVTSGKLGGMKSAVHFTFRRGETMIRKTAVGMGVAVLLGGNAIVAQAGTVDLTGYKWGSKSVSVENGGTPAYVGSPGAGAFVGTTKNFTGSDSWANTPPGKTFITYCVEINETFSFGELSGYSLVSGSNYAFGSGNLNDSTAISNRLGSLWTYIFGLTGTTNGVTNAVDSDKEAAAVQLAIWEIIYEKPVNQGLNLDEGNFQETNFSSTSVGSLANTYLNASSTTASQFSISVFTKANSQDWIAARPEGGGNITGNPVPEPTSLALAFGALGALGFATRRRQATKA